MNAMLSSTPAAQVTMSSLELVEFINSHRGPDKIQLRHDHFMAKVPKVLGFHAPKFLGTQKYGNGNIREICIFPTQQRGRWMNGVNRSRALHMATRAPC